MLIEVNMLLELDPESLIIDQEKEEILENVMDWIKELIYDVDDLSLKYVELEAVND
jgi:hypothetical protein